MSTLFANINFHTLIASNGICTSCSLSLLPTTPTEATFEEDAAIMEVAGLTPVTPTEADFLDVILETNVDLNRLAPITPAEADFNDSIEGLTGNFWALSPTTPAETDFSNTL